MAKVAFKLDIIPVFVELIVGFSWSRGGVDNTSIFAARQFGLQLPGVGMATRSPVDIPDGFPGLGGRRIFLDIMGGCVGTNQVDFDLKIYNADGSPRPVYQAPTVSAPVWGLAAGVVINTDWLRGGVVGPNSRRQFEAIRLGLLTANDIPRELPASDAERLRRFNHCMESGQYNQAFGSAGGLGTTLRCLIDP